MRAGIKPFEGGYGIRSPNFDARAVQEEPTPVFQIPTEPNLPVRSNFYPAGALWQTA